MQGEAEETERQARIQLEIKKTLTRVLLTVTDALFGELPFQQSLQPVCICKRMTDKERNKPMFRATT